MSAAVEDSRSSRRGNDIRPSNQSRQSVTPKDVATSATQSRRGGKAGAPVMSRSTDNSRNGSSSQATSSFDEGPAIPGSDAGAVDAALKQGFDANAPVYKPEAKPQPGRSESPWGTKAGTMANGKDFWLELRKQVFALQQSGGTSQGG
ncbi:hypothetical protein, variant [Exophiala mesophila]|uniref:Uncharacterized protein n=1 Tax=Exophiala mesophila TaxID=212818 RepID=A0A0D1ZM00_EXOME|nr:uncharacterized protein PV10_03282 [Exophiala mesophila]XP_016227231.1 hypothetical protein, variant [Exophiala mesophila]KIV95656.1 hypothetical protein PV10_03282 [Exophiala mesophila]KIV95657.1 hypothetical protein, variant [Exophiala mesophila]